MRKLVWLLILLAALWGAWWVTATTQMQSAVTSLLDARRAAGWEVALDGTAKAGFPLTLANRLRGLALSDPKGQLSLNAPQATLSAPAWWPGDLSVAAPRLTVETRAGVLPVKVTATDFAADLSLHPGLALELDRLTAQSAGLRLDGPDGLLLEVAEVHAAMRQSANDPATYDLQVLPGAITPGPLLQRLFSEDGAPATAPRLAARVEVSFDKPIDRHAAVRGNEPRLQGVDLKVVRIAWGDIAMSAEGTLAIDAEGLPAGALTLKVTNWPRLLDIAQRAALLPPSMRLQVEAMLGALANRGDTPDGLDLELVFADGQMTLAGIPLGPAPSLLR